MKLKIHRGPLFWFAVTFTVLSALHLFKYVTHHELHDIIKSITSVILAAIFLELHMRLTWDRQVSNLFDQITGTKNIDEPVTLLRVDAVPSAATVEEWSSKFEPGQQVIDRRILESGYMLERFLQIIPEPNRTACMELFFQARARFHYAPGSTHNHQAWTGGYLDHIVETMTIAELLFKPLNAKRKLPFTLGDVILCLFLHDIEKPWKYVLGENELEDADLSTKEKRHEFRREIISKYGFKLTYEHWNGIEFAEGEIHQYSNRERHMGRLAAFVHMCDVWSARGWFDEPLKERAKL